MTLRWVPTSGQISGYVLVRGDAHVLGSVHRSVGRPGWWYGGVLGLRMGYLRTRAAAMRAVQGRTDPKKGCGL